MDRAVVEDSLSVPALISIKLDDRNFIRVGGKQLKAGDKFLFPNNVKTEVFVTQSGPDHTPHIGFSISIDHGELDSPYTGAHFEVQTEIKPTKSYNLSFVAPVNKSHLMVRKLPDAIADDDDLATIPSRLIDQSILHANKNGTALAALVITLDNVKFELVTYPPTVAEGPNYGIVHNDEPFDGGATVSKILSSSAIVAYVDRTCYTAITNAFSHGKAANIVEAGRPWGIQPMLKYERKHLERIKDDLFLKPIERPVHVQRITDWGHYRAATVLGMGADKLRMQEDIERLANTACRAILIRAEDGKLIAGLEPPEDDGLCKLLTAVNRGGRRLQVCRLEPVPWDPTSGANKPKLEERDPFPAAILDTSPPGIKLPSSCDVVVELYPRRVDSDAIAAVAELSDMVPSDGET